MNQGWTKLYKEILSGPATLNTRKMYAAFYYETTQRGDGWPKFSLSKLHWASVDTGWLMTVWSVQQREEGGGRGGEMRLKQMSPILSFIDWRAHRLTWGLECKRVGCLVKVIRHWRLLCCVKYDACPGKQEARMILQIMHLEQERRIKDLSWKWSSGNLKKMLGCPHQSKEAYNTWRKPSISIPIHLNGSRLAGICSLGRTFVQC